MTYTEDILVQQTATDYLEQHLGWESLHAHNNEDLGPNIRFGRDTQGGCMSDIVIFEAEAQPVEVRLEGEILWIPRRRWQNYLGCSRLRSPSV